MPDVEIKCDADRIQTLPSNDFLGFSNSELSDNCRTEKDVNKEKKTDSTENKNNRKPAHYDCQEDCPPVVGKQKENETGEGRKKDGDMKMKEGNRKKKDRQGEKENNYEKKGGKDGEKVQDENEKERRENSEKTCNDNEPEQEVVLKTQRNIASEEKREVLEGKKNTCWKLSQRELDELANCEKESSSDERKMTGQSKRTLIKVTTKSGTETSNADSTDTIQKKTLQIAEKDECLCAEKISYLTSVIISESTEGVSIGDKCSHKQIEITERGEVIVVDMDIRNTEKVDEKESAQGMDETTPSREGQVNNSIVAEKECENTEEREGGDSDEKAKVDCEKKRKIYQEEEEQKCGKRKKVENWEEEQQIERERDGHHKKERQYTGQAQDNVEKMREEGNEENKEPERRKKYHKKENRDGELTQDDSDNQEFHQSLRREDIERKERESHEKIDERSKELVNENTERQPAVDEYWYSPKHREGMKIDEFAVSKEKVIKVHKNQRKKYKDQAISSKKSEVRHGDAEFPSLMTSDNSDNALSIKDKKGKCNFTEKSKCPEPKKKSSINPQTQEGLSTMQQHDKVNYIQSSSKFLIFRPSSNNNSQGRCTICILCSLNVYCISH